MTKTLSKLLFLLLFFSLAGCLPNGNLDQQFSNILQLSNLVEKHFENQPSKIAVIYTPEAVLAGPSDEISGQKNIQAFWAKMENPIELDIQTEALTTDIDSIILPVKWRKHFENQPSSQHFIYQQGIFKMEYEDEDVTHQRSITPFTWVWQRQPEGFYRVFLEVRR